MGARWLACYIWLATQYIDRTVINPYSLKNYLELRKPLIISLNLDLPVDEGGGVSAVKFTKYGVKNKIKRKNSLCFF